MSESFTPRMAKRSRAARAAARASGDEPATTLRTPPPPVVFARSDQPDDVDGVASMLSCFSFASFSESFADDDGGATRGVSVFSADDGDDEDAGRRGRGATGGGGRRGGARPSMDDYAACEVRDPETRRSTTGDCRSTTESDCH